MLRTKTTQVKRYSSIAPFVPQKHACKGKTSGLKKISTRRYALGSIFFAALASATATLHCCAPTHSATLRLVLTTGVSACFVSHGRSFLIRGYSCPLKPQQGIRFTHSFFKRGQQPLIVVLACGSLGLIGLSRFLQCSVSFFCSHPFLAVVVVFIPLHYIHTTTHCLPKQEPPCLKNYIPQVTFHSFGRAALAFPRKKLHSAAKNRASPACST
jgi:hypothetical protein